MQWFIEPEIFDESYDEDETPNIERLKQAIRDQGHTFQMLPTYYEWWETGDRINAGDQPSMYYGSLNMLHLVKRASNIRYFCNLPEFTCLKYYSTFYKKELEDQLLNYELAEFVPYFRVKDRIDSMTRIYGSCFVRPDAGDKPFSGCRLYENDWEQEFSRYFYDEPEYDMLCLVAPPREILAEYRMVVDANNNQVITGSKYIEQKVSDIRPLDASKQVDLDAVWYTEQIIRKLDYKPDPIYTMDIALIGYTTATKPIFKVIEVGSFSCAGLYMSNMNEIVKGVEYAMV